MSRTKRNILLLAVGLTIGGLLAMPVLEQLHTWRIARRMARHDAMIREYAAAAGLPYELVRAVVEAESGGDPGAESELGAKGLMQIMPLTEQDVLERNPELAARPGDLTEPEYNLAVGTAYLRQLLVRFDGDRTLAVTAYHMGPTRVAKLLKRHPGLTPTQLLERHGGPRTRAYVAQVLRRATQLSREPDPAPQATTSPPVFMTVGARALRAYNADRKAVFMPNDQTATQRACGAGPIHPESTRGCDARMQETPNLARGASGTVGGWLNP